MMHIEILGWVGATLTFVGYSMRTMMPLRMAAIGANVFFIAYSALSGIMPTLALHLALLPFNAFRLAELLRTTRKVRAASTEEGLPDGIKKYLRPIEIPSDGYLFRKGDVADRIYLLDEGCIRLEEIDVTVGPCELLGEVAFFSATRRRTLSARCEGECRILAMTEKDFTTLFYQSPAFAFHVVKLLARRLERSTPRG